MSDVRFSLLSSNLASLRNQTYQHEGLSLIMYDPKTNSSHDNQAQRPKATTYRKLGQTGMKVSAVGFGGSNIGILNYVTGEDRDSEAFRQHARAALVEAVNLGINYFDTAPSYGDGRSETLYGEVLETYRAHIYLATKIAGVVEHTPEQYTEDLYQSLERLKTDCVDVLQVHGAAWTEEAADTLIGSCLPEWLKEQKAKGIIRHAGITAEAPSGALERLLRSGNYEVLQMAYNVIYQGACDYQREPFGVIPLARSLGMGVVTMRTATTGFMQKYMAEAFPEIDIDTLSRHAIRFVVSTPEVDSALVGMKTVEEVIANWEIATEEAKYLDLEELHNRFA